MPTPGDVLTFTGNEAPKYLPPAAVIGGADNDSVYQLIPTPALQLLPDDYWSIPSDGLNVPLVADRILFVPFRVGTARTLDKLFVITGAVLGNARLGIYASAGFLPAGAPLFSGANIALAPADAQGYNGVALPILTPGIYWVGIWADAVSQLFGASLQTGSRALYKLIAGYDTVAVPGSAVPNYYDQAAVYSGVGAMPAAAPVAQAVAAKHIPFCFFGY